MKITLFKTLLTVAVIWATAGLASAATLQVNSRNFTSEPTQRRRTTLTLTEAGPVVAGPWLVAGDSVSKFTDTNGVAYYSNVLAGAYRLDVAGSPGRSYPITVMDTNVLLNAADLVNSTNLNTSFYTAAQVDALLATAGAGVQVSAAQLAVPSTNAGVVTVTVSTNAVSELATNVTRFASRALGDNLINNGDGTISAYNRWQFDNILNGEQLNSWWINANGDAGFQYLTGKLAGASSVPSAVTNQWQADAQTAALNATNKFKTDIGAGTVPVAASALTGTATNNTTGNAAGATNLFPNANITNGGWVMRIATNMYNNNSNLSVHYYPATNASLPGGGVHLGSVGTTPNASDLWEMWLNVCHDSTTPSLRGSEMQMFAGGNWAIAVGYGAGVIRHLQKGIGPQNPRSGGASWNPWSYGQSIAPFEYEPGYTWADTYKIILTSGDQKFPGIIGRHWTNDAGFGERYELSLLKDLKVTFASRDGGAYIEDIWAISNVVDGAGYYVYPSGALEGLYHRGALMQSQVSSTVSGSTNVALDFGKSAAVSITAPTGAWKFYTTNNLYYSTNYQRMVFLMKYTGSGITNISYPAWYVPTNVTLLTSLPGSYYYRLELESFGIGETNKAVVSATAGTDPTFYYDSDAQSFFNRAGGLASEQRSNAVNQLVLNLKATNLWTVIDAIYPFAGTTDRINTNNLKSSSFGGVFTGTPAQSNGFVSDGTDDYMATGFIPSSAGGNYTQNSAHVAVYTQSSTMDDLDRLLGVYDSAGGIKGIQIRRNATTMQVFGPNNNTYTTGAAHGGDYTGFMCGSRVASDTAWIQVRTTQTSGASTSSALPTKQIYIGANNNDGTAASFTAASYRCVSIGGGLTTDQMNALKWCMEQYVNQMP